jgi:hypothetical protein
VQSIGSWAAALDPQPPVLGDWVLAGTQDPSSQHHVQQKDPDSDCLFVQCCGRFVFAALYYVLPRPRDHIFVLPIRGPQIRNKDRGTSVQTAALAERTQHAAMGK